MPRSACLTRIDAVISHLEDCLDRSAGDAENVERANAAKRLRVPTGMLGEVAALADELPPQIPGLEVEGLRGQQTILHLMDRLYGIQDRLLPQPSPAVRLRRSPYRSTETINAI